MTIQYLYDIVDKNNVVMPRHYSGRLRSYQEARKLVDKLNKHGEYRPYKIIKP